MAHKTGAGSTKNNRDSQSKRLGLKCSDKQNIKKGFILIRQRGMKYKPGINVKSGRDHTLYALVAGNVEFTSTGLINIIKKDF